MSLRTLVFLVVLFIVYFVLYNRIGMGYTTLLIAIIFLIQATVFTINGDYYDKFLKFMNPSLYKIYIQKDEEFIKKKRKRDTSAYYISALIFFIVAFGNLIISSIAPLPQKHIFVLRDYIISFLIIIPASVIANYITKYIMMKSKTASQELIWSLILGVWLAIIITVAIFIYYIFTSFPNR